MATRQFEKPTLELNTAINNYIEDLNEIILQDTDFPEDRNTYLHKVSSLEELKLNLNKQNYTTNLFQENQGLNPQQIITNYLNSNNSINNNINNKKDYTQKTIAEQTLLRIDYYKHSILPGADDSIKPQILNEIKALQDFNLEQKFNTDIFDKLSEVFDEQNAIASLYEKGTDVFSDDTFEKVLDLHSDYLIKDHILTTVASEIDIANNMIHKALETKDDKLLQQAKDLLNPNGTFEREYKNNYEFKDICIKSRLRPEELLTEMKNGGFAKFEIFKSKFVPYERVNGPLLILAYTEEKHNLTKINANGEALNSPIHLKTNKMENNNENKTEKQETKQIAGYVASMEMKGTDKQYLDMSIAINKPNEKAEFKNVRVWENTDDKGITAKVGDYIKLDGYEKTLQNKENKEYTVFNVTSVIEHKPKERLSVTGNLGSDPEFKEVAGKQVASVSIAVKGADGTTEWKRIQMWEDKAEAAKGLKKGDTITVEGKEGKEYSYKKGDDTLTAKDIIANTVEKHIKKTKEELNTDLVANAKKGDWEKVSDNLKKGADSKMITEDHLKDLTPKQQDAIKNTVRSHEDFQAKKEDEKKNSGVKM